MNAKEFFYTVAEMSECQKVYIETHDHNVFRAARKLENIIDQERERVRAVINDSAHQENHA